MSAHQQNPKEKAAVLTLKLRADSGYEADAEYRISAEQWGEVLGICEGTRQAPAQPVNARLLEAAKAVLRNKRGEDDWLILSVDCLELEAAIAAADATQINPQAKGD